jgi:uncharacterized protein with HEPN domain
VSKRWQAYALHHGGIDPETVLTVLKHNLPPLEAAIRAMLAEHGEES